MLYGCAEDEVQMIQATHLAARWSIELVVGLNVVYEEGNKDRFQREVGLQTSGLLASR